LESCEKQVQKNWAKLSKSTAAKVVVVVVFVVLVFVVVVVVFSYVHFI
jgi:hypothetical protein